MAVNEHLGIKNKTPPIEISSMSIIVLYNLYINYNLWLSINIYVIQGLSFHYCCAGT